MDRFFVVIFYFSTNVVIFLYCVYFLICGKLAIIPIMNYGKDIEK